MFEYYKALLEGIGPMAREDVLRNAYQDQRLSMEERVRLVQLACDGTC